MSPHNGEHRRPASFLVCRAGGLLCALPVERVVETMRPLPIHGLADAPSFHLGSSTVRGEVVPVVHLGALVSGGAAGASTRFIAIRLGERRAVLAVEQIAGIRALPVNASHHVPTLFDEVDPVRIDSIARFDDDLLSLLRGVLIVSEELLALVDGEARLR
jgi:purine-binding chemotaxis protein CheW